MAKKKIELFTDIYTDKEFEHVLNFNGNKLICADVYCDFAGPCVVLDHLFIRMKLDWSDGQIVLLRVLADEIEAFTRFRDQSQAVFLFIINKKIVNVFRGVDNIRFAEAAKKEIEDFKKWKSGFILERLTYNLDEASLEEQDWHNAWELEKRQEINMIESRRAARQAARKRYRAELMVPRLEQLNFVLYWPHAKHAHPELYERWDLNNIIMIAREEIQLTKELAEDVLYAGDAPINEASMHTLLSRPALAICFRLLDTDKHFVSLVRRILYEELPPLDEAKSNQVLSMTAFEQYKSYSPTRDEILRQRHEEKMHKKEQKLEKRTRRLSEMQRLARQAIEDVIEAKKANKEKRKLELLKAGNLDALKQLDQDPDDHDDIDIVIPEDLPEDLDEESGEEEDENEYFPTPGLLIPGLYAPPSDIAKTNGLALLFPNIVIVMEHVTPEPEFLPPHVLVMVDICQRYRAIDAVSRYKKEIIHMGIFKCTSPSDASHVAYSVKQFDLSKFKNDLDLKVAFMVSMKTDLALLELMDLNPGYVSRDLETGEEDCALLFGVGYAENYNEMEDFSVHRMSRDK